MRKINTKQKIVITIIFIFILIALISSIFLQNQKKTLSSKASEKPLPPINLIASCPIPGITANLSWNSNISNPIYAIRINNYVNGWKCSDYPNDQNCCTNPYQGDYCFNSVSPFFSFSSQQNSSYNWWIHVINNGIYSDPAVGQSFTCYINIPTHTPPPPPATHTPPPPPATHTPPPPPATHTPPPPPATHTPPPVPSIPVPAYWYLGNNSQSCTTVCSNNGKQCINTSLNDIYIKNNGYYRVGAYYQKCNSMITGQRRLCGCQ